MEVCILTGMGKEETSLSEVKFAQSCPTLCDSMGCIAHGILQVRLLEWVAFPFSRVSSQPRDWTWVSCVTGSLPCCRQLLYKLSHQASLRALYPMLKIKSWLWGAADSFPRWCAGAFLQCEYLHRVCSTTGSWGHSKHPFSECHLVSV